MGRPSGTIETKFTEEDISRIVSSVDSAKVGDVILTRGLEDIATLYSKAASEGVTVSRVELEENAYILKPLLEASPIHTIHVDSLVEVVGRVLRKHTANAEPILSALAWDVKTMLQMVRKIRRSWKHMVKDTELEFPKCAERWPVLLDMVKIMEDLPDSAECDLAAVWNLEREKDGEPPTGAGDPGSSIEERLSSKRKQVMQLLQGKVVLLDTENEEPETVEHAKEKLQKIPGEEVLRDKLASSASSKQGDMEEKQSDLGTYVPLLKPPSVEGASSKPEPSLVSCPGEESKGPLPSASSRKRKGDAEAELKDDHEENEKAVTAKKKPLEAFHRAPDYVEDVLEAAEPSSVPVPKTQNELRAERKAENACKVPRAEATGDTYAMKVHKRKEKPPAFAIHNRRTNKQLGQLLASVVPTADVKVDQLVKELNSGSITEADALSCLNKLKAGGGS